MKIDCVNCGARILDTHPTCGEGWDLCEECRSNIVDSMLQDIPLYCAHCHKPLDDKAYVGRYNMMGDSIHLPGEFWVFHCKDCDGWSRCHKSKDKSFAEAIKEVMEQRGS